MYNLKLTNKQTYLVDMYIFGLCNHMIHEKYSDKQLNTFDISDRLRISLYQKHKRIDKSYYMFSGLTDQELKYMSGEVGHFIFDGFDRDRSEKIIAKNLIKKVDDMLNVQLQRDLKLKELGI